MESQKRLDGGVATRQFESCGARTSEARVWAFFMIEVSSVLCRKWRIWNVTEDELSRVAAATGFEMFRGSGRTLSLLHLGGAHELAAIRFCRSRPRNIQCEIGEARGESCSFGRSAHDTGEYHDVWLREHDGR